MHCWALDEFLDAVQPVQELIVLPATCDLHLAEVASLAWRRAFSSHKRRTSADGCDCKLDRLIAWRKYERSAKSYSKDYIVL